MDTLNPLRHLFAWAMLGYVALELLFTLLNWVIDPPYANFTRLTTLALPLIAVLIATHIQPVLAMSNMMTLIAMIEYAAVLFFGALAFLIGLPRRVFVDRPDQFDPDHVVSMLGYLAFGVAELGIAALAGYAVYRVFRAQGNRLHPS